MLDRFLTKGGSFGHCLPDGRQAWIYTVSGQLAVRCESAERLLTAGIAATVGAGRETEIALQSDEPTHFALMAAKPICEPFVKRGPLVMSTEADVDRTLAYYAAGKFGHIPT